MHCDYLQCRHKGAQRRRVSPDVALNGILEHIVTRMKCIPEVLEQHFSNFVINDIVLCNSHIHSISLLLQNLFQTITMLCISRWICRGLKM